VLDRLLVLILGEAGGEAGAADEQCIDDERVAISPLHIRVGCSLLYRARLGDVDQVLNVLREVLFVGWPGDDVELCVRFGLCGGSCS
jgi:hypothetical protein